MLGTIWLDGYDINASMVDSGYAWVYRFEDNAIVPGYIKYESAAQKEAKGLWADTDPATMAVRVTGKPKAQKVKEEEIAVIERASSVTSVGTKRFRSSNHACLL
ncbi:thermonuclease family protein [Escherichia coli]